MRDVRARDVLRRRNRREACLFRRHLGPRPQRDDALRRVVFVRSGTTRTRERHKHERPRVRSLCERNLLDIGQHGLVRGVEHLHSRLVRHERRFEHGQSHVRRVCCRDLCQCCEPKYMHSTRIMHCGHGTSARGERDKSSGL